jgi:hypothetical protein
MNYSDNPGHCLVTRFKLSGKYYDQFQIDMSPYWDEPSIFTAVGKAINDTGHWKYPSNMTYVCLEPYHRNAYPIMLPGNVS